MFNVYRIIPTYDYRDAIVGHRAIAQPMTYLTLAGASARVGLLEGINDRFPPGEDYFVIVPVGASPFDQRKQVLSARGANKRVEHAMDDIPF